jgi:hypothetical protein
VISRPREPRTRALTPVPRAGIADLHPDDDGVVEVG